MQTFVQTPELVLNQSESLLYRIVGEHGETGTVEK